MTIWKGDTPSFETWRSEVEHEHRMLGDFEPPFIDDADALKRYQFLVRIGFFDEDKKEHNSVMDMFKNIFG